MPIKIMKNPETNAEMDAFFKEFGRYHKNDPRSKKKTAMKGGGYSMKRPEMMKGGMANGKKHMYAAGGSVMDSLTPGQKKMVMAMARENKS